MSAHNRVVWSEGLFLQPQHFQQQDRYFEHYIETRCRGLVEHGWGFTELELERDLLSIGKVALGRASGVFPDGTPFRMPDDDPLPLPFDVGSDLRDQRLHLAVPLRRPGEADVDRTAAQTDGLERYVTREWQATDASSGSSASALLQVAPLKTRLLPESDITDAYACLPLVHVLERRADEQVVLDEEFMPTVLRASVSARLATVMTELVGLVHQRGDALSGRVAATGRGSAAEFADFLMLQTLNRYEPLLAHYAESGALHPEDLYRAYVAIAGELSTFTTVAKRPQKFPAYRHERLRESFAPVVAALRAALGTVLEQHAIAIPIEAKKYGINVALIADRSLYGTAVFILAARADVAGEELRQRFPSQLKVGPVEKIRDLVTLQLPGVAVRAVPAAPRQIPFHAGFAYFEFDQSSELWDQLKSSGGLALHVAGDFPKLAMELWAIRS